MVVKFGWKARGMMKPGFPAAHFICNYLSTQRDLKCQFNHNNSPLDAPPTTRRYGDFVRSQWGRQNAHRGQGTAWATRAALVDRAAPAIVGSYRDTPQCVLPNQIISF